MNSRRTPILFVGARTFSQVQNKKCEKTWSSWERRQFHSWTWNLKISPLGKEILFENHDFQVPCSTWGCFVLGSKLPGQLLAASECWLNPGLDRWVQDWTYQSTPSGQVGVMFCVVRLSRLDRRTSGNITIKTCLDTPCMAVFTYIWLICYDKM